MTILKGNILHTPTPDRFDVVQNGYIVAENGVVVGVYPDLPKQYESSTVVDFGDKLIIPGFVDAHAHAPQYENIGLGYDKELLPWLETYTFPEEAKFHDTDYAKQVYPHFVQTLYDEGTTRSVLFGTIHNESTELLMALLAEEGLGGYVGKVSMDRNAPPTLTEQTDKAIADATDFVTNTKGRYRNVRPIVTPRFVPTCSSPLMAALGKLAANTNTPVQSHLSENKSEIDWVSQLHPTCANYAAVYDQHGLLGQTPTIMAHCVHLLPAERAQLKQQNVLVAHCPTSNVNLSSGIAPISQYLADGLSIGLGSDVSGGHSLSMRAVILAAIQQSKLYNLYVDAAVLPLTTAQAFYLATKGGGSFFGSVGSFETGYALDALVLSVPHAPHCPRTPQEQLEKFITNGNASQIVARFVDGERI